MLVSIIVPCYNQKKYIKQCINSIRNQSYGEIEIIVVNDGSIDKSEKIIDEIKKKDSRIKLININNSGVEHARIVGIDNAVGEYIMFVDGDDMLPSDAVLSLVEHIENTHADFVSGNYIRYINGAIKKEIKQLSEIVGKVIEIPVLFDKYYASYFGWNLIPVQVWGKIYRSSLVKSIEIKEYGLKHGEDLIFNMQIFLHVKKYSSIDKAVYIYRYGGMTTKFNENLMNEACHTYMIKHEALEKYDYQIGFRLIAIELLNFMRSYIANYFYFKSNNKAIAEKIRPFLSDPAFRDAIDVLIQDEEHNDFYKDFAILITSDLDGFIKNNKPSTLKIIIKRMIGIFSS